MLPDRVSNPGPLTYESGALPIALRSRNKWHSFVICYKQIASGRDFDRNSLFYLLFIYFFNFVLLP